jgi:hypothetical protein
MSRLWPATLILFSCVGAIGPAQPAPDATGSTGGGTPESSGLDAGQTQGDAGAPDAGEPDAGPPGTVACPSGAVFCESFESGVFDPAVWKVNAMPGAITIDPNQGKDGTHSLHLKSGTAYGFKGIQLAELVKGIPTPDDRLYARIFLRFGDLRLPGYHPNFITVVGPDYKLSEWPIHSRISFGSFLSDFSINAFGKGLDGAKLWEEHANDYTTAGDSTPATEHGLKAGEWFCVEIMGFGDDQGVNDMSHPNEEMRVWINDVEIPELYGNDPRWGPWGASEHWSPPYNGSKWSFGLDGAYADGPTLDIWFDAIAFSNTRIGCN